jgi:hypothetical protein
MGAPCKRFIIMCCCQAYQWMQGQAMQPLEMAEAAVLAKTQELGQEFCNTIFSGISTQELKKHWSHQDTNTTV